MTDLHSLEVIPIWPNGAPGSEHWPQQEQETCSRPDGHRFVRKIAQPTLTLFLPDPTIANGIAAIICPGVDFSFSLTGLTRSAFLPSAERYFSFIVFPFWREAPKWEHRR